MPGNIMATHLLLTHGPDHTVYGPDETIPVSSHYSGDGTTKFTVIL